MKEIISSHDAYKYLEVFVITGVQSGFIIGTQATGFFIKASEKHRLSDKYTTSSVSTKLLSLGTFGINLIDPGELQ
jgi:hypothetical protein